MADESKPEVVEPKQELTDTGRFRIVMAEVMNERMTQFEQNLPETIRKIVRDELAHMARRSSKAYKYLLGLIDMDSKE